MQVLQLAYARLSELDSKRKDPEYVHHSQLTGIVDACLAACADVAATVYGRVHAGLEPRPGKEQLLKSLQMISSQLVQRKGNAASIAVVKSMIDAMGPVTKTSVPVPPTTSAQAVDVAAKTVAIVATSTTARGEPSPELAPAAMLTAAMAAVLPPVSDVVGPEVLPADMMEVEPVDELSQGASNAFAAVPAPAPPPPPSLATY